MLLMALAAGTAAATPFTTHQSVATPTNGTIRLECTGGDAQIAFAAPVTGTPPFRLFFRMKSESRYPGQVFWATASAPEFSESATVRFDPAHDGQWHTYALALPATSALSRLRIDPSCATGRVELTDVHLRNADNLIAAVLCGQAAPLPALATNRPDVACYYFPQWHADPQNEAAYGKGWSEWPLAAKAKPRFPGHRQPLTPAWNPEPEDDPQVMARKIAAAADHGIDAFVFDWYFNAKGPFLNGALEHGFLAATNRHRLKFALMWANHDLISGPGALNRADFDRATDHMIRHALAEPNYWRLDGRLYVGIYEVGTLLKGLGGVEAAAEALNAFRDRVRRVGLGELHLNASAQHFNVPETDVAKYPGPNAVLRKLGFDSVTPYHWIHLRVVPNFPASDYAPYRDEGFRAMREAAARISLPYLPVACMGWDPSPRTPQDQPFVPGPYPWGAVLTNNTPAEFRIALEKGRDWFAAPTPAPRAIFIEAWNEWTEGSYLEPDTVHGTAYLEAVRDVLGPKRP